MAKLKFVETARSRKSGNSYAYRTVYWDGNVVGQLSVGYSYGKIWKYTYIDQYNGAVLYAYVDKPEGVEPDHGIGSVKGTGGWQYTEFPELTFRTAGAALADLKKRILKLEP